MTSLNIIHILNYIIHGGGYGRVRMVVGFSATCCELSYQFEPRSCLGVFDTTLL
jgi:hypothetical protein